MKLEDKPSRELRCNNNAHSDSYWESHSWINQSKTTFIHFYIESQKQPFFRRLVFVGGAAVFNRKGYFTVFCSVLKVNGEERLSLSNSDACHSYITIIHIYFISRSFWHWLLSFFVEWEQSAATHVCTGRTRVMSLSAATCQTGCLEDPVFI